MLLVITIPPEGSINFIPVHPIVVKSFREKKKEVKTNMALEVKLENPQVHSASSSGGRECLYKTSQETILYFLRTYNLHQWVD